MSIWDNPTVCNALDKIRDEKREKMGRLSYDCFNLKVKKDRVFCSKGKKLGCAKDGTLNFVSVIRGLTSGVCKNCKDFDGD